MARLTKFELLKFWAEDMARVQTCSKVLANMSQEAGLHVQHVLSINLLHAEEELKTANESHEKQKLANSSLQNELQRNKELRQSLGMQLDDARRTCVEHNAALKKKDEEIAQLKVSRYGSAEIRRLEGLVKELQGSLQIANESVAKLQAHNVTLVTVRDNNAEDLNKRDLELAYLKNERDNLQRLNDSQAITITTLRNRETELNNSIRNLNKTVTQDDERILELSKTVQKSEAALADSRKTVRTLDNELERHKDTAYSVRCTELRSQRESLTAEHLDKLKLKDKRIMNTHIVYLVLMVLAALASFLTGFKVHVNEEREEAHQMRRVATDHEMLVSSIRDFGTVCQMSDNPETVKTGKHLLKLAEVHNVDPKTGTFLTGGSFEVLPVHDEVNFKDANGREQWFVVCKLGDQYKAISVGRKKPEHRVDELREGQWIAITNTHPLWPKYAVDMDHKRQEIERDLRDKSERLSVARLEKTEQQARRIKDLEKVKTEIVEVEAKIAKLNEQIASDSDGAPLAVIAKTGLGNLCGSLRNHEKALTEAIEAGEQLLKTYTVSAGARKLDQFRARE